MFFKYARSFFIVLTLLFTMVSCSWWGSNKRNEKSSKTSFIDADIFGDSSDCLAEIDDFFVKYFKGLTTKFDVTESIKCVSTSLDVLFDNTLEVDVEAGYSRQEFINILARVWSDKSLESIEQNIEILFLAKRLFVGGGVDGFTRSDLASFKKQISGIESALLNSNTHIKFWLYNTEENFDVKKVSLAIVSQEMRALDELRKSSNANLTKEESYKLLNIIFSAEQLVKFQKLIRHAFDVVFGDEEAFVHSQNEIFQRIHTTFKALATLRSARFPRGLFFGSGLSHIYEGLFNAFKSFISWSEADHKFFVETSSFTKIISEAFIVNGDKREEHPLATTTTQFLEKFLGTKELRKQSFVKVINVMKTWHAGQQEIVRNYQPSDAKFKFDDYSFTEKNEMDSLLVLGAVGETNESYFLQKSDGSTQYLYNRGERSSLTNDVQYYDLSLKNLFAHFAFRAYQTYLGNSLRMPLKTVSVNKTELTELLLDIRPLALDMGITNPYSCTAADNFMLDANLFTTSGNGDELLDFVEALELLYMSYSASSISRTVYESIDPTCELDGMKYLGNSFMDRECVKRSIFSGENTLISSFSEFSDYYGIIKSKTSRGDWYYRLGWTGVGELADYKESNPENLKNVMFSIVNLCGDTDTPITKQEIQSLVGLTQYIENWFSVYDQTGQGIWMARSFFDSDPYDYVLDGNEIKKLFDDRLRALYYKDQYTAEDSWFGWRWAVQGWNAAGRGITNRGLKASDLDRYRAMLVLDSFRKDIGSEPHDFQKRFCESIISSAKESRPIEYNEQRNLRCDGTDNYNAPVPPRSGHSEL